MENKKQCGANGYALDFGFRYCNVFLAAEQNWAPLPQQWSQYVRNCLQRTLGSIDIQSLTCDQIATYAIGSHAACYNVRSDPTEPTFCDLSWSDRATILWEIKGVILTSRIWSIAKQGVGLLADCGASATKTEVQTIQATLDGAMSDFASWTDAAISDWISNVEESAKESLKRVLSPTLDWDDLLHISGFNQGSVEVYFTLNLNESIINVTGINGTLTLTHVSNTLIQQLVTGQVNTTYPVLKADSYQMPKNYAGRVQSTPFLLFLAIVFALVLTK